MAKSHDSNKSPDWLSIVHYLRTMESWFRRGACEQWLLRVVLTMAKSPDSSLNSDWLSIV